MESESRGLRTHIIGAAAYDDAIIVTDNDDRAIMGRRVKGPLGRRVKVVGVNYGNGGDHETSTDSGEMLFDSEMVSD
jgi:hypothetical protein